VNNPSRVKARRWKMPGVRLFDSRELRRVLGTFVTGVTVVTTTDEEGGLHGVTANSFSSVSLDPPLVLWSQAVKTHSHPVFFKAERFAVNILAEDQIELSNRFAKSSQEKFAGLGVDVGLGGVPLLRGCNAWLQCRVVSRLPGGDHTIYVGEVESIARAERRPLAFGNGQYLRIGSHDLGVASLGLKHAQLAATRLGAHAIERLVSKFDETMALAVWGNLGPTITHWEPASAPVSDALPVGLTLPVTSTATGMAFAAHLPAATVAEAAHLDGTASQGEERDWGQRLEDVRRTGLARQGLEAFYRSKTMINALSVPVLDASGQAVLALTAVGEANRFPADLDGDFACALRETAKDLSCRLGYDSDAMYQTAMRPELTAGG
jgi:flavin reductase (DIM6/NTAB) family NADH-FMN oxidoreductase RutF